MQQRVQTMDMFIMIKISKIDKLLKINENGNIKIKIGEIK